MILTKVKCLCLNDDFVPLCIITAKKALKRTLATPGPCTYCDGRGCNECCMTGQTLTAKVIEYHDVWIRDSKGREYPLPSIICNNHHVRRNYNKVQYSRNNVLRRDNYTCQYCGGKFTPEELTLDHVIPRSQWKQPTTPTNFTNIVTSCLPCNQKKDRRTPKQAGMQLRHIINGELIFYDKPKAPSYLDIVVGHNISKIPKEWEPYLSVLTKRYNTNAAIHV